MGNGTHTTTQGFNRMRLNKVHSPNNKNPFFYPDGLES